MIRFLLHNKAGYQRMRTILARQYSIQIPQFDPEGMTAHLCQTCKHRVFHTYGPNHIWLSCDAPDPKGPFITNKEMCTCCLCFWPGDGHDKLKELRLTTALKLLIWLPGKCISCINMVPSMSTCNQRIESLWSQMMKQQSSFQSSMKIWADLQNNHQKRRDHNVSTPTACTPYFAYISSDCIQFLLQREYPEIEKMFTHTPDWFHEVAVAIMGALESNSEHITIGNFWHVFSYMLPISSAF
ncbi:hypothetical protein VP01_2874g5 [Puccinia sorghi]|uniref:Uncharacterized protein n=1 Tax=Puccinia sorghi TaxID=27349 RepID=A0A0L6V1T6_9BASI|nr:hypothetical protein VP01_2874g5 [Puccinia sorghi]